MSRLELVPVDVKPLSQQPSAQNLSPVSIDSHQESLEEQVRILTQKLDVWQANVTTYIEVKESCRNTISIVFEKDDANLQMVNNEHIIKLYFSKLFQLG